jgi:branched-chain amino acid transport system permease protein
MRGPSIRQATVILAAVVFAAVVISQSWAGNPITGASIVSATVSALSLGAIYALAASGLVVTYTTTGIFNFAQGAIGMVMAYIFWQCTQSWGWPQLPSVLLVVFVIAPAFGVLLYVVLMRHLVGADLVVQIMATIGLMVGLIGLAAFVWDPQNFRQVPYFLDGQGFHVGDTFVLWHRAIAVVVGVVAAVGLRTFLRRTRTGLAMRAVVDDPDLAALHAAPPARVSALAWAISASLAATAGLLLAPEVQLSIEGLTLLIIDAFAAAILGRLRSLPLTVAGGILLGALNAFALGYLQFTGRWTNFVAAIPTIVLFFALLGMPAARIQVGRARAKLHARVPRLWEATLGSILFVLVVALVGSQLTLTNQNRLTVAVISALLLLSLVPLIGWAGQVSLAPMAFAGVGAYAMVEWAPTGSPEGLVFGALLAIPFGVLMALPALRLRGLYFALASIAFARGMELLFFTQPEVFGDVSAKSHVARPDVLGLDMANQLTFLVATAALFAVAAIGLVALRRSRYGRRLTALRDSEAATTTVGLDVRVIKLAVFSLSAMLGAVAGALLAIQRGTPSAGDFTMFAGLALTLFLVVGGVALFGGILQFGLALLAIEWASRFARLLEAAGPAFAAIGLARNPYGSAGALGANLAKLLPWRRHTAPTGTLKSPPAPTTSERGTSPPTVHADDGGARSQGTRG